MWPTGVNGYVIGVENCSVRDRVEAGALAGRALQGVKLVHDRLGRHRVRDHVVLDQKQAGIIATLNRGNRQIDHLGQCGGDRSRREQDLRRIGEVDDQLGSAIKLVVDLGQIVRGIHGYLLSL